MSNNKVSEGLLPDKLLERREEYNHIASLHGKNEQYLNIIYYSMGIISTIGSSALALLTSLYPDKRNALVSMSFGVLCINSILNFGQIERKISKHRDMRIQFRSLVEDIDMALDHDTDKEFVSVVLAEKHKLLMGYEVSNTFCFE